MLIPLSYPLKAISPLYPGTPDVKIDPFRSMELGDSANASTISFGIHSGTHIDAPRHFCPEGKTLVESLHHLSCFESTYCIYLPLGENTCVTAETLKDKISAIRDANAVLIHTGFCNIRDQDPVKYRDDHPYINPDVPDLLRKAIPDLRLFGIDVLSISRPDHRQMGHASHKSFLCGKNSILLLEDVDLRAVAVLDKRFTLYIYPWITDAPDGTPVTALASVDQ